LASTIKSNFEFDIEGFINIADFLVGRLHLLFPKRGRWGGGTMENPGGRVIKRSKSRGGFVIIVIVQSKRCPHPTPTPPVQKINSICHLLFHINLYGIPFFFLKMNVNYCYVFYLFALFMF
jgi:hypothetical protein